MRDSGRFKALSAVTASWLLCFLPGYVLAANLVTNGSFETGTAGWTISAGTCAWQSLAAGSSTSQFGAFVAPTPAEGTHVLLSDAAFPEICTLQQDVSLPGGTTLSLTLDAGYNFRAFSNTVGGGCQGVVSVATASGVPIAQAYLQFGVANQALAPQPPVDLTAYAGTTVRIFITTVSCTAGVAGLIVDNVAIDSNSAAGFAIPTLSKSGIVFLALLLALAGMLFIGRNESLGRSRVAPRDHFRDRWPT